MIEFLVIVASIFAAILELIGIWLIGNKNKMGFISFLLCGILWIFVALTSIPKTIGLLIVVPVALVINIRNYLKWKKEDKAK